MHLVIFEGNLWPSLAPFSFSRPVFALHCGTGTLLEQQIRALSPSRLTLWVRPNMVGFCKSQLLPRLSIPADVNVPLGDQPALLSSGRLVHMEPYQPAKDPFVELDEHGRVARAWVHAPGLSFQDCLRRSDAWLKLLDLPHLPRRGWIAQYAWDLAGWNEQAIVAHAKSLAPSRSKKPGPYHMAADEAVYLSDDAQIGPGAVLDASKGPVIVESGANIGANSVLEGPCYVGNQSVIVPLTLIRGGTSIGPGCKVGGEIKSSIMLANSNKAHYGYLGDSYVGEWVNLGAGTTTSNLKNTYGLIKAHLGSRQIPTGRQFVGSLIGDHAKLAIGTRLMSGSYVGYCAMWAASAIAPRMIGSMSYWTDKGREQYKADKAIEMITAVYARRGRAWTEEDHQMLHYAAETAEEVERG
ncbi:MAG TPA: putative sugar nucleotidyl transferase [Tepidisphaeraceae bacterium]|nr:putative sugar nucleotidyl transferase [Tepidisphaeraceae bacterium]